MRGKKHEFDFQLYGPTRMPQVPIHRLNAIRTNYSYVQTFVPRNHIGNLYSNKIYGLQTNLC